MDVVLVGQMDIIHNHDACAGTFLEERADLKFSQLGGELPGEMLFVHAVWARDNKKPAPPISGELSE
ncbi:hypothetical protein KbCgl_22510 [Corynebacterium glutamicum]|nr:hypothetical protein KbCgl_22510 [Corynebacterium glutamicum]